MAVERFSFFNGAGDLPRDDFKEHDVIEIKFIVLFIQHQNRAYGFSFFCDRHAYHGRARIRHVHRMRQGIVSRDKDRGAVCGNEPEHRITRQGDVVLASERRYGKPMVREQLDAV